MNMQKTKLQKPDGLESRIACGWASEAHVLSSVVEKSRAQSFLTLLLPTALPPAAGLGFSAVLFPRVLCFRGIACNPCIIADSKHHEITSPERTVTS